MNIYNNKRLVKFYRDLVEDSLLSKIFVILCPLGFLEYNITYPKKKDLVERHFQEGVRVLDVDFHVAFTILTMRT
jgi:hypothetical protein